MIRVDRRFFVLLAPVLALMAACTGGPKAEMKTVEKVDLARFMGDWYVIANIPTSIEKGAHNAVESYRLDDDGSIDTTFTFRDGAFDGKLKTYNPRGFVVDRNSNALWGMRFIWPIKADYRIVYVDEAYSQTVIGRQKPITYLQSHDTIAASANAMLSSANCRARSTSESLRVCATSWAI